MRNYGKCVQKEKSSSIRTSSSTIKKKELSKERKFQSRTSLEFYNKKRKSEIIERKKANLVNNDEQDSWKITKAAINEPQQLRAFIELVKICDREEKETKRKNKNKDGGEKG